MRAFSEVYISTNMTVLLTLSMGITPCPVLDPMLFCGGLHDAEAPQGHPGRMERIEACLRLINTPTHRWN